MVKNQRSLHIDIDQTVRLRREATDLLRRLEANREANDRVCAEIGKRDAMRFVTGRTAIERAIETTRGMIQDLDHLLRQVADEFSDADGELVPNHTQRAEHAQHEEHLVESR